MKFRNKISLRFFFLSVYNVTGVYRGIHYISYFCSKKYRLLVLVRTGSPSTNNLCFQQKYEKSQSFFLSENFQFLEITFSIYLNRRVFVMVLSSQMEHDDLRSK